MMPAVIGIRDLTGHTGTGHVAIVVLAADPTRGSPEITSRMDKVLVPEDLPARVYHESAGLPVAEAEALVAEIERVAERAAQAVLAASIAQTGRRVPVLALPIDANEAVDLPPVAAIVASHSLMHVAETALYREALLTAAQLSGIDVHRYEPATVATNLAKAARLAPAEVDARLAEWGRMVGRPWRRPHKEAALGAWITSVVLAR